MTLDDLVARIGQELGPSWELQPRQRCAMLVGTLGRLTFTPAEERDLRIVHTAPDLRISSVTTQRVWGARMQARNIRDSLLAPYYAEIEGAPDAAECERWAAGWRVVISAYARRFAMRARFETQERDGRVVMLYAELTDGARVWEVTVHYDEFPAQVACSIPAREMWRLVTAGEPLVSGAQVAIGN